MVDTEINRNEFVSRSLVRTLPFNSHWHSTPEAKLRAEKRSPIAQGRLEIGRVTTFSKRVIKSTPLLIRHTED